MKTDLLGVLDGSNDIPSSSPPVFQTSVPSSSVIAQFWPESQHIIALPHDLQRTVASQFAAIYIGFNLLIAITRAADGSRRRKGAIPAVFSHHMPWILDMTVGLWGHVKRWSISNEKRPLQDEIFANLLRQIELVLFRPCRSQAGVLDTTKDVQSLINTLFDLLENDAFSKTKSSTQAALASILIRLRRTSNPSLNSQTFSRSERGATHLPVLHDLEAKIITICQTPNQFMSFQKDLQVCKRTVFCRILLTKQSCRFVSGLHRALGLLRWKISETI